MSALDEMISMLMDIDEDHLEHVGKGHLDGGHSGRYPYGSGKDPYQHALDFRGKVDRMKSEGKTESEIAAELEMPVTELRTRIRLYGHNIRAHEYAEVKNLSDQGMSATEIGKLLGKNESSVRSILKNGGNKYQAIETAEMLKKEVERLGLVEVGLGTSNLLNISKEKLGEALILLSDEGYELKGARVPQATNPEVKTTISVLCPPGSPKDILYKKNFEDIHYVGEDVISYDGGKTYTSSFHYPTSLDSKRLQILYAEDGGTAKDGVIELRRGVADLSLGDAHYAQVRIMVDGTHYLKGMAVYADDLPEGIDVRFNSNKPKEKGMYKALKEIKPDPDNPFGSLIKEHGGQSFYDDPNGTFIGADGQKQSLSLINKRAEEGDWGDWSDHLPAQMLSKQSTRLAERQLKLTVEDVKNEYAEIMACDNPVVRQALLSKFADSCDGAAIHLKAAALPRQKYQVILPLKTIGDNEIYAPNYRDGEQVALIRYPHAGTFEIPILTVNNKNKEGIEVLTKNPQDAVGISSKTAGRLSGADFDGDTVVVIPTNNGKTKISSRPVLKGMEDGFDTSMAYGPTEEPIIKKKVNKKTGEVTEEVYYIRNGRKYKAMNSHTTQVQMGVVSNLITDMTIAGAPDEEMVRAVKHSMVVIDAEKHKLDYIQSERDNDIESLKKKYQKHTQLDGEYHEGGASTLISRAKSETTVLKRQGSPRINEEGKPWYDPSKPEGSLVYKEVREEYVDKKGKTQVRTIKVPQMSVVDNAETLISDYDTRIEHLYADYANTMKAMANQARKEVISIKPRPYSPEAKKKYAQEVEDLDSKINMYMRNKPKERRAQALANAIIEEKIALAESEGKPLSKKEKKKERQKAITNARRTVGADSKGSKIVLTDSEWEAIQSGAISTEKLKTIIKGSDLDSLRERATPRQYKELSESRVAKIKAMKASGNYTTAEIAVAVGCSSSTVNKYLNN